MLPTSSVVTWSEMRQTYEKDRSIIAVLHDLDNIDDLWLNKKHSTGEFTIFSIEYHWYLSYILLLIFITIFCTFRAAKWLRLRCQIPAKYRQTRSKNYMMWNDTIQSAINWFILLNCLISSPVSLNGMCPFCSRMYANTVPNRTTRAFLASENIKIDFPIIFRFVDHSAFLSRDPYLPIS